MAKIRHVDASRCHIGRDEHANAAVLEAVERRDTSGLRAIAVNARRLDAMFLEQLEQAVGPMFGAGEHQRLLHITTFEQFHEQRGLEILRDGIQRLRDTTGRRRLPLEIDLCRVLLQLARQLHDCAWHRGAEQQHLFLRRQLRQDALDVRQKSHVEHAIRFVEHQMLHTGERCVRLRQMVEQTTGRRDHQIHFRAERMLLRSHADATVDGGARERRVHRQCLRRLQHLQGEFAGRYDDQCASRAAFSSQHAMQDRQQERRGLATAGLCAGEDIPSIARRRDRVALNRRGPREPQFLDGLHEGRVKRQGCERGNGHGRSGDEGALRSTRNPVTPRHGGSYKIATLALIRCVV